MLVYFRISNFKSIVDTTLDMRYSEGKAPNGYKDMEHMPFLEYPIERAKPLRLSPVMVIYGQNAGGKTTIVESMYTLRHCLHNKKLFYRPNKLHSDLKETTFEVSFVFGSKLYTYSLCYNRDGVKKEFLKTHLNDIFSIDHEKKIYRFENLSTESYSVERLIAILKTECSNSTEEQIIPYLGKR